MHRLPVYPEPLGHLSDRDAVQDLEHGPVPLLDHLQLPKRCGSAAHQVSHSVYDAERLALAGYRGLPRETYTLDLRRFTAWCRTRPLPLFAVRRADIESFAGELEAATSKRYTALTSHAQFSSARVTPLLPEF